SRRRRGFRSNPAAAAAGWPRAYRQSPSITPPRGSAVFVQPALAYYTDPRGAVTAPRRHSMTGAGEVGWRPVFWTLLDTQGHQLPIFLPQPASVTETRHIDRKSTRLNSSHVAISYAV